MTQPELTQLNGLLFKALQEFDSTFIFQNVGKHREVIGLPELEAKIDTNIHALNERLQGAYGVAINKD